MLFIAWGVVQQSAILIVGIEAALGAFLHLADIAREHARSIKGEDEIRAMRCAHHACDQAVLAMEEAAQPGMSENEIRAILHAENIKRGGEWSSICYPNHWHKDAFPYQVEAVMVFCVEALVSPEGGDCSIKLEDQVLITDDGFENLTRYPFDPSLLR